MVLVGEHKSSAHEAWWRVERCADGIGGVALESSSSERTLRSGTLRRMRRRICFSSSA